MTKTTTKTVEAFGKEYQVQAGKVIASGKEFPVYAIIEPKNAPVAVWNAVKEKGLDVSGRVYAGGAFVPRVAAELALEMAEEQRESEAAALREAVPGIDELNAAINAQMDYSRKFNSMMEDENNDGVFAPKAPESNVDELMNKYPVAAAYVQAEGWSHASHHVKSVCGRRAMARIVNGENHEIVIAEMDAEFTEYCQNAVD